MGFSLSSTSAALGGAVKNIPPPLTGAPASTLGKLGGGALGVIFGIFSPGGKIVSEEDEQRAIRNAKLATEQGGTQIIEKAPDPPFTGGQSSVPYVFHVRWKVNDTDADWEYADLDFPLQYTGAVTQISIFLASGINSDANKEGFPLVKGVGNRGFFVLKVWLHEQLGDGSSVPAYRERKFGFIQAFQVGTGEYLGLSRGDGQPDTGGDPYTGEDLYSGINPNLLSDTINSLPPGTKFAGLNDNTAFPPRGNIFNPPKPAENKPPPIINNNITNNNYYTYPPAQVINNNPAGDIGGNNNSLGGQPFFIPTILGGDIIPLDSSDETNKNRAENQTSGVKTTIYESVKDRTPTIEEILKRGDRVSLYPDAFLDHIDSYRADRDTPLTNTEILDIINRESYSDSGIKQGDISDGAKPGASINIKGNNIVKDTTQARAGTLNPADLKSADIDLLATSTAAIIFNPANTQKLENAAAEGVCQTTQSGGCMQQNILNPLQQGQANLSNLFNNLANTGLAAQNAAILAVTQNTNALLKNTTYGLEAIQNFASKAWEATHMDKVINIMNLITATHNASMLSRNVGESIAELGTNVLSIFNITYPTGETIDVGEVIGNTITGAINAIVPEAIRTNLSTTWLRLSRIHSAAVAMASAVTASKNALLEVNEITANWVALIGNTQQEQGLVEEDSYPWMKENNNFKDPYQGFLGKLNNAEEVIQQASSFVSSAIELQDSVEQLATSNEELKAALDEFNANKATEEEAKELESASPTIENTDLIKSEEETEGGG